MFSLFQIDFAAREFVWALGAGLVLASCLFGSRLSRAWRKFAELPVVPAVAAGLAMLLMQTGVALKYGWPVPAVHDEFSYLLAADTFASGRATNPTHPGWEFFETYHVLSKPSYQSKYPPGSGLVLALGQVLTGQPIVGVWICLAAATAGLYWMLRGWFASRWALLGAVILIFNWPVTKLSGQTYFGGAPALLGAVLVYGAFARLLRRPSVSASLCLGIGLVIWAIARPYEGLVASLIPVAILTWRALAYSNYTPPPLRGRCTGLCTSLGFQSLVQRPMNHRGRPGGVELLTVLGCGLIALGWYHWQVTGDPFVWPYRLYDQTYTRRVGPLATVFAFTGLGQRERTIPSQESESSAAQTRIAETKPALYAGWKLVRQWWFHVGLLWTLPLCVACVSILKSSVSQLIHRSPLPGIFWRGRGAGGEGQLSVTRPPHPRPLSPEYGGEGSETIAFAMLVVGLVGVAILLQRSSGMPHYAAPIQPLLILLIIQGLRRLWVIRNAGWHGGQFMVTWLASSCILFYVLPLWTGSNHPNVRPWSLERNRIQQELSSHPRPSLVIVKYGPKHSMHEEWVYNRADIDRAHIVWARDLGQSRLPELLRLFPDRDVWIVEPDQKPLVVQPMSPISRLQPTPPVPPA